MNNYFEKKLNYNKISFRYAQGKSLMDGNEIHTYHEILYYIDGDATFLSEEFQEKLDTRMLLIIPKESYHQLQIKNQNEYTRLVINFPDFPRADALLGKIMTQIKIVKNLNSNISNILNRMCRAMRSEEESEELSVLMYGAFLMLLSEICIDSVQAVAPKMREDNRLIFKCVQYIEKNFGRDITVDTIAKEMHVSESTLFHCFKNELGISMYKYITQKRMIYAHRLIKENKKPSEIYLECGYNDYSTFYKAYMKMFGRAPSADAKGSKSN